MKKNNEVLVLFSGGTDSTLAAALATEKFDFIHLVTYSRLGIASVENSKVNAKMLIKKYGQDKISHKILKIDKLFKYISYENYFGNLKKYGFNNLSTCGLCKLSMHIKTVEYALENNIGHVCDGANAGMTMFPAQMRPVVELLQKMYAEYGIVYSNPVFDYDAPEEASFISSENKSLLKSDIPMDERVLDKKNIAINIKTHTSGQVLFDMGLAPSPNVKGTKYDKERQPRCYQFVLFNIFAIKYYLNKHSYEDYETMTTEFFREKIQTAKKLVNHRNDLKFKRYFKD